VYKNMVPYQLVRSSIFRLGKCKVFPVLSTEHHAMKAYWGSEGIALRILDLGTRWR
jgi:hypothetical protein